MIEACIVKAVVVQDEKTKGPVLKAVVEMVDEMMNVNVPFALEDVETDHKEFMEALRDKIAEGYDIPVYRVNIKEDLLLKRMIYFGKQLELGRLN